MTRWAPWMGVVGGAAWVGYMLYVRPLLRSRRWIANRGDVMRKRADESSRSIRSDIDELRTTQERLDSDRPIGGKEAIGRIGVGAVDDDLAMVGLLEPVVARLVAGDEPVGVDHLGESVGGFGRDIAAPGQGVDRPAALHGLGGPDLGREQAEVEIVEVAMRREPCGRYRRDWASAPPVAKRRRAPCRLRRSRRRDRRRRSGSRGKTWR